MNHPPKRKTFCSNPSILALPCPLVLHPAFAFRLSLQFRANDKAKLLLLAASPAPSCSRQNRSTDTAEHRLRLDLSPGSTRDGGPRSGRLSSAPFVSVLLGVADLPRRLAKLAGVDFGAEAKAAQRLDHRLLSG